MSPALGQVRLETYRHPLGDGVHPWPTVRAECPLCHAVRHAYSGTRTLNARIRVALYNHFLWSHPQLGVRERSMLADRALREAGIE